MSRQQLQDDASISRLWKKVAESSPEHGFLQIGLKTVNRAEAARIANIWSELHFEQVTRGRHFHAVSHDQIEQLEARALAEVQSGTLLTNYDMSRYSVPSRKKGNPHFWQKVSFLFTRRPKGCMKLWTHGTGLRAAIESISDRKCRSKGSTKVRDWVW